ncbi:MAG: hypothetical protein KTR25_21025 [Myxococcales bacterium]|nr:hypothetical protein [Myxococcales bacterium]
MLHQLAATVVAMACVLTVTEFSARAQSDIGVTITLTPEAQLLASELEVSNIELETLLRNEIADLYGLLDIEQSLKLSAQAQALVPGGMGADYSSNPGGLFFGIGVNAALTSDEASNTPDASSDVDRVLPINFGGAVTLMAGYNFAKQKAPWFTASLHGMYFPVSAQKYEGEFINFGINTQFKVIGPSQPSIWIEWGGLDVTTGFNFAKTRVSLNDSVQVNGSLGDSVRLQTLAEGEIEVTQTAQNLSLELTSNTTLLTFLTLYGGFGLDVPLGGVSVSMSLSANLTGVVDGNAVNAGSGSITTNEESQSDVPLTRGIVGLQLNIWSVKLFAQVNLSMQEAAVGAATGLRVVF